VRALYDVGEGDPTPEIVLDTAVPSALELDPSTVFQGDRIRSLLYAENLLFVQGELSMDLGEGLEVTEVEVRDVNTALLHIQVQETASPGFRDLLVVSGPTSVVLADALEVVDGADRRRVVSVEPAVGRQGTMLELEIWTSEAISEVGSVDLGDGIVVLSIVQPEPRCLRVTGWIDLKAPLGERMVLVDDGSRIWSGERFKVLDQAPPTVTCSSASNQSGGLFLVLLGLVGLLRRKELSSQNGR
jgi:MYXO-CTERM domain-containing protein